MGAPAEVAGFRLVDEPADRPWRWPVYRGGDGPPVVVIHELYGLTPEVLGFGCRLVEAGFSVWLPVLSGPVPATSGPDHLRSAAGICVSREIHLLATGRTSPVVAPLRALARHAVAVTGAPGAGVVGMCFSGGFALALAAGEPVLAAVAAQPSLPYTSKLTPWCARDLGMSDRHVEGLRQRLRDGKAEVYVTRFSEDSVSPAERLEVLRARLGDTGIVGDVLPSGEGNPYGFGSREHSVLAVSPARHPCGPAHDRLEQTLAAVVGFLGRRLGR